MPSKESDTDQPAIHPIERTILRRRRFRLMVDRYRRKIRDFFTTKKELSTNTKAIRIGKERFLIPPAPQYREFKEVETQHLEKLLTARACTALEFANACDAVIEQINKQRQLYNELVIEINRIAGIYSQLEKSLADVRRYLEVIAEIDELNLYYNAVDKKEKQGRFSQRRSRVMKNRAQSVVSTTAFSDQGVNWVRPIYVLRHAPNIAPITNIDIYSIDQEKLGALQKLGVFTRISPAEDLWATEARKKLLQELETTQEEFFKTHAVNLYFAYEMLKKISFDKLFADISSISERMSLTLMHIKLLSEDIRHYQSSADLFEVKDFNLFLPDTKSVEKYDDLTIERRGFTNERNKFTAIYALEAEEELERLIGALHALMLLTQQISDAELDRDKD